MIFLDQTFKTIQIACYIVGKETDENRVYRFLLPKILASHTESFFTKTKMNEHLEDLYGAYFKTGIERVGHYHLMHITLTIVDPDLVSDPLLLKQAIDLFKDVLNPNRTINPSIFEEERRLYIEQHKSIVDRKRTYANYRFNQYFFKHDVYQKPLYGGLKALRNATHETLMETWKEIQTHDTFFTVCHGMLNDDDKALLSQALASKGPVLNQPLFSFRKPKKEVLEVIEQTDMKQAIIKLGYILPIYRYDSLYEAAILLDTMLGGYPESELFKVIREEKGLCYDIYSSYDSYRGVLMITSGVDRLNHQQAIDSIKEVILDMEDRIALDSLIHAKQYVIHQIKSSLDSQSSGTKRAFMRRFLGLNEEVDKRIQKILSVTETDIKDALKKLTLDTVYVLEGVPHETDTL